MPEHSPTWYLQTAYPVGPPAYGNWCFVKSTVVAYPVPVTKGCYQMSLLLFEIPAWIPSVLLGGAAHLGSLNCIRYTGSIKLQHFPSVSWLTHNILRQSFWFRDVWQTIQLLAFFKNPGYVKCSSHDLCPGSCPGQDSETGWNSRKSCQLSPNRGVRLWWAASVILLRCRWPPVVCGCVGNTRLSEPPNVRKPSDCFLDVRCHFVEETPVRRGNSSLLVLSPAQMKTDTLLFPWCHEWVVLNQSTFCCPPRGHLGMHGDMFGCHSWGTRAAGFQ